MSTLRFKVKKKYGKEWYYPSNNSAEIAAKLARQKSLTREQVNILQTLGLKIEIEKVKQIITEEIEGIEEFKDE